MDAVGEPSQTATVIVTVMTMAPNVVVISTMTLSAPTASASRMLSRQTAAS